jgi:hypothetical protein
MNTIYIDWQLIKELVIKVIPLNLLLKKKNDKQTVNTHS